LTDLFVMYPERQFLVIYGHIAH